MKPLKKILDFLFGHDPEIFDEKGQVRHRLPPKVWTQWKDRTKSSPSTNWRQHAGTKGPHAAEPR